MAFELVERRRGGQWCLGRPLERGWRGDPASWHGGGGGHGEATREGGVEVE